ARAVTTRAGTARTAGRGAMGRAGSTAGGCVEGTSQAGGGAMNSRRVRPLARLIYTAAPVNRIGALSPAARDKVNTTPVSIPDIAEGKTTSLIVSNLVAPTASAASLVLFGILFSASSVVVII